MYHGATTANTAAHQRTEVRVWDKVYAVRSPDISAAANLQKLEANGSLCPLSKLTIAAVLADMDAELAALEARRDKTRDLKQAMMQELLTGKTRLVAVRCAHA